MNPAFGALTNLGIEGQTQSNEIPPNGLLPFLVSELQQGGIDLNGDGDAQDLVLHILDTNTGLISNQMFAGGSFGGATIDGNLFAFCVDEFTNGNTDLNGDGTVGDCVLHVKDLSTGIVTNAGISIRSQLIFEGSTIAFSVNEQFGENKDLNGDGDVADQVLHLYDVNTKTITNLGFAGAFFIRDGNFIVFTVNEAQQNQDLNFDGDMGDRILHFYNIGTSTVTNLQQFAVDFNFDGNTIAFNLNEGIEGVDLNGDGDFFDRVLHIYDVNTGITTNLGLASGFPFIDGNIIAFASEDGAVSGVVYHIFDILSGVVTNLGLTADNGDMDIKGNIVVFVVDEFTEGVDLNGDGDAFDQNILHVLNISTGVITNLGTSSQIHDLDIKGNIVAFLSDETSGDLNGDGDTLDLIPQIFDAGTGVITNIGLEANAVQTEGSFVVFTRDEGVDGVDLNNDGDAFDQEVAYIFDIATATITNLEIVANVPHAIGNNAVVFEVGEEDSGNTDLNGDGDVNDSVLHLFTSTADTDGDGVSDTADNCPAIANPSQTNTDDDTQGDACDSDDDNDGIADTIDSSPLTASSDFADNTVIPPTIGTVTSTGDQTLSITDEANPAGVRIKVVASTGPTLATVNVCGSTTLSFGPVGEAVVTCGSTTIQVITGSISTLDGSGNTIILDAGDFVTLNDDFTITNNAGIPTTIEINGNPTTIGIGETITVGEEIDDKSKKKQDKAIKKAQKAQDKADKKQAKADKEQDKADKAQAKADNAPPEKQVKEQKKADKAQAKADKKQDKADKEQDKACKKIQKEIDKLNKKGIAIPVELQQLLTDNCS